MRRALEALLVATSAPSVASSNPLDGGHGGAACGLDATVQQRLPPELADAGCKGEPVQLQARKATRRPAAARDVLLLQMHARPTVPGARLTLASAAAPAAAAAQGDPGATSADECRTLGGLPCLFGVDARDEGRRCIPHGADSRGWCYTSADRSAWGSCGVACGTPPPREPPPPEPGPGLLHGLARLFRGQPNSSGNASSNGSSLSGSERYMHDLMRELGTEQRLRDWEVRASRKGQLHAERQNSSNASYDSAVASDVETGDADGSDNATNASFGANGTVNYSGNSTPAAGETGANTSGSSAGVADEAANATDDGSLADGAADLSDGSATAVDESGPNETDGSAGAGDESTNTTDTDPAAGGDAEHSGVAVRSSSVGVAQPSANSTANASGSSSSTSSSKRSQGGAVGEAELLSAHRGREAI